MHGDAVVRYEHVVVAVEEEELRGPVQGHVASGRAGRACRATQLIVGNSLVDGIGTREEVESVGQLTGMMNRVNAVAQDCLAVDSPASSSGGGEKRHQDGDDAAETIQMHD